MKNRYRSVKYRKSNLIGFCGYLCGLLGIICIIARMWGYKANIINVGIVIASIGVLTAITISYITLENRKISDLVRYFIISNELFQTYIDEKGRERLAFFPYIEQKKDTDNVYIRFRLDGSKIAQKLKNQEQALAECFETICTDVIEERGYITYVLQKKKEDVEIIHSWEELPRPEEGKLIIGRTIIDWKMASHLLITGVTQSGKTTVSQIIMAELRSQGVRIYYYDPKNDADLKHYCKMQDIKYYSDIDSIEKSLFEIEEEMRLRQKDLDAMQIEEAEFNPVYIFVDELIALAELMGEKRYKTNILSKISSIITQGAKKRVFFGAILQRCDTRYLPGAIRDNLGIRIAMGHQTETAYNMIFPDFANVKNYRTEKGTGLIYCEGFDTRPKELVVPFVKA